MTPSSHRHKYAFTPDCGQSGRWVLRWKASRVRAECVYFLACVNFELKTALGICIFYYRAVSKHWKLYSHKSQSAALVKVSERYVKTAVAVCVELTFKTSTKHRVHRRGLYGFAAFHEGMAAVWDLNRLHRLSSSISCRNPCTVPEFKSGHEYGTVRLEFPYGKAACHSERQHQLLPSQAWNTKFRDYDKSGRPGSLTAMWGSRRTTC